MTRRGILTLIAMSLAYLAAHAQTDVQALQKSLKGKPLALRSYSAEPLVRYAWVDGKLSVAPASAHTLRVFTPRSIKYAKGVIVFEGFRKAAVLDDKRGIYTQGNDLMKIEVDLHGADPAGVFPVLSDQLFFPNLDAALAAAPTWSKFNFKPSGKVSADLLIAEEGKWFAVPRVSVTAPKTLSAPEPIFPIESMSGNKSGTVSLHLALDANGRILDVWIVRSVGYGLDESAVQAARKCVFTPAEHNGHPVGFIMVVDYSFDSSVSVHAVG